MAVKVYALNPQLSGTDNLSSVRQPLLWVCDTVAELPTSGLQEGDLLLTKDTDSIYAATSATTTGKVASVNNVGFRIENLTSDPSSPTIGQIWLRTDL